MKRFTQSSHVNTDVRRTFSSTGTPVHERFYYIAPSVVAIYYIKWCWQRRVQKVGKEGGECGFGKEKKSGSKEAARAKHANKRLEAAPRFQRETFSRCIHTYCIHSPIRTRDTFLTGMANIPWKLTLVFRRQRAKCQQLNQSILVLLRSQHLVQQSW